MDLGAHKIRVGVLRGGPSPEYKISLETGKNVLHNLPDEYYEPVDIFISREGSWHLAGVEKSPQNILHRLDVVWNGLHGQYGEDGRVQKILELFGIPYVGSSAFSSASGLNKALSKRIYQKNKIKTPVWREISEDNIDRAKIAEIYSSLPMPFIVKPAFSGSSLGIYRAYSRGELEEAVLAAFEYSPTVLVEEFIDGKAVSCGVVENFRGENYYSMIPHSSSRISAHESEEIENLSSLAHQVLGLRHYSSSDFILHPKRGIFILETDVLPALQSDSPFTNSLKSIGSNISEFLHHTIQNALQHR